MVNIEYPYRSRGKISDTVIRIEVMADSMRVGKTTAVKVLAEGFREKGKSVFESYEDWEHNPYLKNSYVDPEKNFLDSQKWFIQRKWEQINQVHAQSEGGFEMLIQDVSPEMDYCYAETNRRLGRMSDESFAQYHKYFGSLDWDKAPAPQLLVYLEVSDDELIRRAMDSRREFETVDPAYFLMMKKVNREWLLGAEKHDEYHILRIDTDKLDFAHERDAKNKLIELVEVKIDLF